MFCNRYASVQLLALLVLGSFNPLPDELFSVEVTFSLYMN